jgi:hypothetical protein
LAAPTVTDAVRAGLEARIVAGEKIGAPEIRRARGGLKWMTQLAGCVAGLAA